MPLPNFINGYGLAEQVRIGQKELAALSLFSEIMKKIETINIHIGTVKDDVSSSVRRILKRGGARNFRKFEKNIHQNQGRI